MAIILYHELLTACLAVITSPLVWIVAIPGIACCVLIALTQRGFFE
jgi:hypothetical protein